MFLFQLQICGSSSACLKKTRCKRMAPVPPFWDICQWKNFPGNLNTWPNTSSKRFFLLLFLQPKKNVQKSMLLHWCCPLIFYCWIFLFNFRNLFYSFYIFIFCWSSFKRRLNIDMTNFSGKRLDRAKKKSIRDTVSLCFSFFFCHAISQKNGPNPFSAISLAHEKRSLLKFTGLF